MELRVEDNFVPGLGEQWETMKDFCLRWVNNI